jgi:hypothetical protein
MLARHERLPLAVADTNISSVSVCVILDQSRKCRSAADCFTQWITSTRWVGNIQFFLDMDNIMLNGYGEILVWVYPVQRQPYIIGTDKNYHIGHTKTKKYVFRDCLTLGLKLYWASPKEHTLLPIF